eukprot:CAMPEP_0194762996 /NCGR_PEP_ID=MMETSP0323_2-20130528/17533_1 /TAXON_ID=2866 ORGANISM="Crypthecodinium cohnii, Strain Seligo" /NCGR_SAMPLE_ID=MMETSP0323_2 /ASSEMBLY_ACC=CAM_ASM_000346 /LENGTH=57 /DNA_ID=CAMNT_0039686713 /DNA_START=152 /DNA_END=323 /DNA_ORIENTATION=-
MVPAKWSGEEHATGGKTGSNKKGRVDCSKSANQPRAGGKHEFRGMQQMAPECKHNTK